MLRWNTLEEVPSGYGPSVVTLGNFDGVHRGHRALLSTVTDEAQARGVRAVAVTFDPPPLAVLHPERAKVQIAGLEHRLELMAGTDLDAVLVLEFTRELAAMTPEEFVHDVFVEALGATAVVLGTDSRFGVHNSGDINTMRELGQNYRFDVVEMAVVGQATSGLRNWSSTHLRQLLAAGEVDEAADILARPHRVSGEVVHGHHRGREFGFPTANLGPDMTGLIPADGVYAGWLERLDLPRGDPERRLPSAISVGTNPTFDDVPVRLLEAHVLDRTDLDLYHEQVGVDFVARLRGNVRFESVEELLTQIGRDVDASRSILLG
ncbi:bifunctional riboflavin kinase/FAD synthetase [Ornithinimicrobium ciconiae]|uniref:Riboflavin biosynthesis protein n=1 Tax=Ornithinimicrobium ciconiae TaxID=2594265 RepID=A0A516GC39_9MICO|nr:bifunctional riboflavin kinase/FAD synthetase [Ornithinimicrobium ciconiae]QDO89093.1 bifunctional riboflavin kinase/FAD synthetase [Ornithinimicrobium ciconiae]